MKYTRIAFQILTLCKNIRAEGRQIGPRLTQLHDQLTNWETKQPYTKSYIWRVCERLHKAGYIKKNKTLGGHTGGGTREVYYTLTPSGAGKLLEWREQLREEAQALGTQPLTNFITSHHDADRTSMDAGKTH